jgi:hypothetical protein
MLKAEDVEFYTKKGYLKIHSSIMNQEVYMVKSMDAPVPDKALLRFGEDEIRYMKKLKKQGELSTPEELRVLTMAKDIFGGNLIDAHQAQHKRSTARTTTRTGTQYKQPKKWQLKSQARPSV